MTANLLPPPTAEEYEALKESIRTGGFWPGYPILVDENGDILDGFTRDRACRELGVEPVRVVVSGLSPWEKIERAMGANIRRRHLSPAQRRELLKRLKQEYDKVLRAEAAEAKRAGNAKGGKASKSSAIEPDATEHARARSAGAEAAQTRFDEPVVAVPKQPAASTDRLSTLASMLGTSRATVHRDEQILDRMDKIEAEAQRQRRDDVLRLLNQPRPNLDDLERAVGLRAALPAEDTDDDRLGWVDNLAAALRHLSPTLTPDEADRLVSKCGDPGLLIVQVGQLRGAIAEAKQRRTA